jgi:hypothetical protein
MPRYKLTIVYKSSLFIRRNDLNRLNIELDTRNVGRIPGVRLRGHKTMSEQLHMRDKLKFQDRREMQLFAEQVLHYRLPDKQFHSFGYHQPNTDEQRQVYTITDHTLYYFLPEVSRNAVTNAIFDIRKILRENPLMEVNGQVNAIKTAVLLGDSNTDTMNPNGLSTAEYRAEIQQFLEDQVFQSGRSAVHPMSIAHLDMGLSYLNEDVYWDVRRDRIEGENGYRTPVTDVLTAIKTAPTEVLATSPPVDRPRYMRQPIGDTTPTIVPPVQPVQPVEPVIPAITPAIDPAVNPDIPLRSGRSERTPLNWWENTSSLALLAAITLAGLLAAMGMISLFRNSSGPEIATNNIGTTPVAPSIAVAPSGTAVVPLNAGSTVKPSPAAVAPAPATPAPATPAPATPAPATPTPQLPMLLIQSPSGNFNAVNLREGPGSNFASLGAIRQGNYVVDRAEQSGDWRRVSYFNKTGWVYMPFIR